MRAPDRCDDRRAAGAESALRRKVIARRRQAPMRPPEGPLRDRRDPAARPCAGQNMYAWAIRQERHGPPDSAMQLEVVPTWPIGEDEVLVLVMAAGVNYNGVWAALGQPISPLDVHKDPYPHRRLRRLRHRLGGRRQGEALEGRRRGRRPLQPGRRRRRGVQWRRPDVLAEPAHLGLRDAGRLLRAVLPRAGAPADAAAAAPDLGGVGLLHADAGDRLPHAVRPPAAYAEARPERAGLGRLGRARLDGGAADRRRRRQRRSASSRTRTSATSSCSSAPRASSTARTSTAGARCRRSARREYNDWLKEARKFGKAIWDITGKGNNVDIVFEHPGEATFPVSVLRGEARRHGGDLRRHHGLQPHLRRALSLDAPEARPGLAFRQSQAGRQRQPAGDRARASTPACRRSSPGATSPTRT